MARPRRRREEPVDADRDLGPPADAESVARTIVLTKLTSRAQSRSELTKALAAKDVPDEIATAVLDRFEQVGLVDDQAFADAWVDSRRGTRGLAGRALAQELRRKGVDDEIVHTALARIDPDDERAAARELVDRKLRSLSKVDDASRFRRLTGLLARKGYPPGVVMSVVREALADHRDGGDLDAFDVVVGSVDDAG
jgi:regulatory protein